MNKFQIGENVRWYISNDSFLFGEIVEFCEDGTVWVEFDNGEERKLKQSELVRG